MKSSAKRPRKNPIRKIAGFLRDFVKLESSSGIILLAAAAIALVWANSPWAEHYFHILETPIGFQWGGAGITHSLHHWINDALMTLFFFVIGLEIKREFVAGELSTARQAAFPAIAAVGGMVVPALVFALFNTGHEGQRGWGVPMATDIAFALGVLALLGNRVPNSLKVFLMALAIIDDLGSVLVIAFFYTSDLSWSGLGWSVLVLGVLIGLSKAGVRKPIFYAIPGIVLWWLLLHSGIHGTIAGVLVAWTIPATSKISEKAFTDVCRGILDRFQGANYMEHTPVLNHERLDAVMELERTCERVEPPLQRMEHALHPWTSCVILPLFAWANAGVQLAPELAGSLGSRVSLGIFLGLVVGKPLGILLASMLALKLGCQPLSGGVRLPHFIGVGLLGGIGFTMSIFVSGLAFGQNGLLDVAKISIFLASAVAGIGGYLFLYYLGRKSTS